MAADGSGWQQRNKIIVWVVDILLFFPGLSDNNFFLPADMPVAPANTNHLSKKNKQNLGRFACGQKQMIHFFSSCCGAILL